ncbi:crossover junction endodeoxyribonuclease RuvC [Candidatus Sumerlaeota bacterium]|nr:crossover junction endodeoxyribonuclease RuvC [Candidatus Sumerlaeota bacterium]
MVIMGIDPGLASTGVGVIEGDDRGEYRAVFSAYVITQERHSMPSRLQRIFDLVAKTIADHQPVAISIESIFFAKNVRSSVLMAHGRGAAMLAASQSGVGLNEYTPLEIKKSVVGKGHATKDQVKQMVTTLLALRTPPKTDHEADALAAALCHAYRSRLTASAMVGRRTVSDAGEDSEVGARKALLALSVARGKARRRRRV